MAKPIISDSQSRANILRELLLADPALHRLGLEVVRTEGSDDGLRLRIRSRDRLLTLERGGSWKRGSVEELKKELKMELLAELEGARGEGGSTDSG